MNKFSQISAAQLFLELKPKEYKYVDKTWYQITNDGIYKKIKKNEGMIINIHDVLEKEIENRRYQEYMNKVNQHLTITQESINKVYDSAIIKLGTFSFAKGIIEYLKEIVPSDQNQFLCAFFRK